MRLRHHALDGAALHFDRESGLNVRVAGPSLRGSRRSAPRVVHLGLTNRCNLRCAFCFRDRALGSGWTAPEIVAWAGELAAAGVLEMAFGQGEPLLFPGFTALVRALHRGTPLAVNFTTNGLLLDDARLAELEGAYGQIRLSYYDDNAPLQRARWLAARGARFGVNLLVTPASLPALRSTMDALVDAGCGDLLLLGYNGPDPSLHLSSADDRALTDVLLDAHARHGERLLLKLSVCFGRRLAAVPQLLLPDDCGAGDDFITLDSERRLLGCSFHGSATPVASAAQALALYRRRRSLRAPAGIRGCARPLPVGPARDDTGVVVWRGWASNHSTSYTLVGELPSAAKAEACAEAMRALLDRCAELDERPNHPRPSTVWELLGRAGPAPAGAWETSPSSLTLWRPDLVVAGGRRVVVHAGSLLGDLRVFSLLLLERHGRILVHESDWRHAFRMVFGVETAGDPAALAAAAWPSLVERVIEGPRLYALVDDHELFRLAPLLARFRRAVAVVPREEQGLAEALATPAAPPARGRPAEWLLLQGSSPAAVEAQLDALLRDPQGALAAIGWRAPFRMPGKIERMPFRGGLALRSEGAPIPGALQRYFIEVGVPWMQLIPGRQLRVRVSLPEGSESEERRLTLLSERALAGLSRPGWARVVGERRSRLDLFPKAPRAAFAQLDALYGGEPNLRLDLSTERPLAEAVATIRAELDEGPPGAR